MCPHNLESPPLNQPSYKISYAKSVEKFLWHERMTDSKSLVRSTPCFLSTLSSQTVLENSDITLCCTITGHPKPEITWYKNGQDITESDTVSNYEILEDQFINTLHLYSCTQKDAAVYQISARNCFGMICCSAFIQVKPFAKHQLFPDLKDDIASERKKTEAGQKKDSSQVDQKEQAFEVEGNFSSQDTSSSTSTNASLPHASSPCTLPSLETNDHNTCCWEENADVTDKGKSQHDYYHQIYPEEIADDLFFPKKSDAAEKRGKCCSRKMHSKPSNLTDDHKDSSDPKEEVFISRPRDPKMQKYISSCIPLTEIPSSNSPRNRLSVDQHFSLQVACEGGTHLELLPETDLPYKEECLDDDLEYLDCSNVMMDYSEGIWQKEVQGLDPVFLLESKEETGVSEGCLGGWKNFLSEKGGQFQVSDNTEPMDTAISFCVPHSKPKEVAGRNSLATFSPTTSQTGMTLTLGHHQDETSTVKDRERYELPIPSAAVENDYPGIEEEGTKGRQTGDLPIGGPMNMNSVRAKPSPRGLEKSAGSHILEATAENRPAGAPAQRKGLKKLVRVKRPGDKEKLQQLNCNLKESVPEGGFDLLVPEEIGKRDPVRSDSGDGFRVTANTTILQTRFQGRKCAIPTQAQKQEIKSLKSPVDSIPQGGGGTNCKWKEKWTGRPLEISQVLSSGACLQVQGEETNVKGKSLNLSQASPEPERDPEFPQVACPSNEIIPSPLLTLERTTDGNGSPEKNVMLESWTLGLQSAPGGDHRGDNEWPGGFWENRPSKNVTHETGNEIGTDQEQLTCFQQSTAADPSNQEEPHAALTASVVLKAPEDQGNRPWETEGTLVNGASEGGNQGTSCDTSGPSPGTSGDKYLPWDVCPMDSELAEGQDEASDLCPLSHETSQHEISLPLFKVNVAEPPHPKQENGKVEISEMAHSGCSPPTPNDLVEGCESAVQENEAQCDNTKLAQVLTADPTRDNDCNLISSDEAGTLVENNFLSQYEETGEQCSGHENKTEAPSIHSLTRENFKPKSSKTFFTDNIKCLHIPIEGKETQAINTAIKGRQVKYLAVSIAQNNHSYHTQESLSDMPADNVVQLPYSEQCVQLINDSITNSTKQLPTKELHIIENNRAPDHPCLPNLLEGEDLGSNSLDEIADQFTSEKYALHQAVNKNPEENHQADGKESEGDKCQQGTPSEDLRPKSAAPESDSSGQLHLLIVNAGLKGEAETGKHRGPDAKAEGAEMTPTFPSSSAYPLGEPKGSEMDKEKGKSELGNKEAVTLKVSVSEQTPSTELLHSEIQESETKPGTSDKPCEISEEWNDDNRVPEPGPCENLTSLSCFQLSEESATIDNRKKLKVQSNGDQCIICSHNLRQLGILGSSVDPDDEKKECVTHPAIKEDLNMGAEDVGEKGDSRIEPQHEGFCQKAFTSFLNYSEFLGSSVDPIKESNGGAEVMEISSAEKPAQAETTPGVKEENWSRNLEVKDVFSHVQCHQIEEPSGEGISHPSNIDQSKDGMKKAADESDFMVTEPETLENESAEHISPNWTPSGSLAHRPHEEDTNNLLTQSQEASEKRIDGLKHRGCVCINSNEPVNFENEYAVSFPAPLLTSSGPTEPPRNSSIEETDTNSATGDQTEEHPIDKEKNINSSDSAKDASVLISVECVSYNNLICRGQPALYLHQQGFVTETFERTGKAVAPCPLVPESRKFPKALPRLSVPPEMKTKQDTNNGEHLPEGVKKKILSRVAALKLRLEEKANVQKNFTGIRKISKMETVLKPNEEKKDPKKDPCKKDGKAPVLLKKIQAEMFPDHSGNIKLCCQFAEIHEESTILWTKDSKLIARVHRSAGDHSTVSLAIVQASKKDQGLYYCCLKNTYGKVTAEFNLTSEVLEKLSCNQDIKGCEEIEFSQLIFREDFISDSYFGGNLRGHIATEELHFGEGVHRKAFRSRVMQGLTPVFLPGHACVLKVHNAIAYGTKNNDELVQRNYKLATQECYVQNTARQYAKIYAAEAQPLEGFGEVPEIIPIFLIHRPENNIPYATVEEELIGEFVKYSIRDGKEINFLRRESEAGQKCCTFQHWVYQKTSGGLLVTDMQGVGMKLTDVGIATLAKGYKGFKGNCSISFIDQFKALHQCNKYCEMLGLKSLQANHQKQRKPTSGRNKVQPNTSNIKKTMGVVQENKT
ncbi:alpha-protein kinase 2 [Tachyglossus aculeatus]|uniref:alpha-protein kinase 2 n=1 Tax=Tachyglossus aculeatus TaxID=9261 RepID=UPI0018F5F35C|nr:alpha-protein kinase 2 [Tachyglossus aculeatus]